MFFTVILSVYRAIEEKLNIQLQFMLVDSETSWNIFIAATLLGTITDTEWNVAVRSCTYEQHSPADI